MSIKGIGGYISPPASPPISPPASAFGQRSSAPTTLSGSRDFVMAAAAVPPSKSPVMSSPRMSRSRYLAKRRESRDAGGRRSVSFDRRASSSPSAAQNETAAITLSLGVRIVTTCTAGLAEGSQTIMEGEKGEVVAVVGSGPSAQIYVAFDKHAVKCLPSSLQPVSGGVVATRNAELEALDCELQERDAECISSRKQILAKDAEIASLRKALRDIRKITSVIP